MFCSKRSIVIVLYLVLGARSLHAAEPLRVIYPQPETQQDERARYPLEVLKLALERSGARYRLQPSTMSMQQARALRLLESGSLLDIAWSATSKEREKHARPIRIPIDRGLIGWRVALIRAGEEPRFEGITNRQQLAPLRAGQGHDWPDLAVLRDNGLSVVASPTYEGLFAMLVHRRIDYFPRSVVEVGAELNTHPGLPIVLEQHLLLHYPSALYFFVSPTNKALADAVTRGLERSLADGSLQRLFDRTYAPVLARLHLHGRRVIKLDNPQLPQATPRHRRELWFTLGDLP